ncbi:MAG: DNA adenine methylase, partial [Methanosarcinales archaeon]|nr:DNA adenine methylase [Methanosarcinales archaeon]
MEIDMKRVPHPIPYQGSKRNIARTILSFFPHQFDTLVEPFAGSAAISLAAASYGKSH